MQRELLSSHCTGEGGGEEGRERTDTGALRRAHLQQNRAQAEFVIQLIPVCKAQNSSLLFSSLLNLIPFSPFSFCSPALSLLSLFQPIQSLVFALHPLSSLCPRLLPTSLSPPLLSPLFSSSSPLHRSVSWRGESLSTRTALLLFTAADAPISCSRQPLPLLVSILSVWSEASLPPPPVSLVEVLWVFWLATLPFNQVHFLIKFLFFCRSVQLSLPSVVACLFISAAWLAGQLRAAGGAALATEEEQLEEEERSMKQDTQKRCLEVQETQPVEEGQLKMERGRKEQVQAERFMGEEEEEEEDWVEVFVEEFVCQFRSSATVCVCPVVVQCYCSTELTPTSATRMASLPWIWLNRLPRLCSQVSYTTHTHFHIDISPQFSVSFLFFHGCRLYHLFLFDLSHTHFARQHFSCTWSALHMLWPQYFLINILLSATFCSFKGFSFIFFGSF